MRCPKCNHLLSAGDTACPSCGSAVERGRLAYGIDDRLARSTREELDRVRTEALLERQGSSAQLTRDLYQLASGALAPSEIEGMLDHLEGNRLPSLTDLERFVASDVSTPLAIDGIALGELLEHGVNSRELLRKGMIFLRTGRYREAVEWWTLHRRRLADQGSTDLLLLIMELLTCALMEDHDQLADLRKEVRMHPCYARLTQKKQGK